MKQKVDARTDARRTIHHGTSSTGFQPVELKTVEIGKKTPHKLSINKSLVGQYPRGDFGRTRLFDATSTDNF